MRLILALLSLPLIAQTTIRPDQIRLVPSPLTTPAMAVKLAAWDAAGTLTYLDIGPGVAISGGKITATAQLATPVLITTRMTRSADGTYQAPTGIVCRNGVIQREGDDYTVAAGVMTPVVQWSADDTILSIAAALMIPTEQKKP